MDEPNKNRINLYHFLSLNLPSPPYHSNFHMTFAAVANELHLFGANSLSPLSQLLVYKK